MSQASATTWSIGIDIGGTFTDVVAEAADGRRLMAKVPSSRSDPASAVRRVLAETLPAWKIAPAEVGRFVHGTTVATNAVLERKGARLGLLTTAGFEDVLEIGRQKRTDMYDLHIRRETPSFLAPGARRRGVVEETGPDGGIVTPLDEASLAAAVADLVAQGVEAVAISFLFSFANPAHERQAAAWIAARHPGLFLSLSSDVDPAFREYERTCVTAFDAYAKPVLDRYLAGMAGDLAQAGVPAPLQIMQSRGGTCSAGIARLKPVRLFLSGPAAGVIGGCAAGLSAGFGDLVTVDIGGTSCDVALVQGGEALIRQEGLLDGYTVRTPMVDVNAIGAGGGSIAWIDAGGGLRVGPQSAGAEPGPACYARGGADATITDASVVLGWLDPAFFAGGTLRLDPALAAAAIDTKAAKPLGMSRYAAALGMHRVLNAAMSEAIRLVSVGRGVDPRGLSLVPLGGGGGIHATALASELGIPRVLVPRRPGVLSAAGLLAAPVEHEAARAFPQVLRGLEAASICAALGPLDERCAALLRDEGLDPATAIVRHEADVCYVGQSHHLAVPLQLDDPDPVARLAADFRETHARVHGHATAAPARIVNLRAIHRIPAGSTAEGVAAWTPEKRPAEKPPRRIVTAATPDGVEAPVWDRLALAAGAEIAGPAIVEQPDTTILVEPGWHGRILADGTLLLERR